VKNIRPDLKKTILTGMSLGKAFLINMGTYFIVGKNYFFIDWHNNLLYHGDSKYRLDQNRAKQIECFALKEIEYNLDGLRMVVFDKQNNEAVRICKWENINIED
jgi:hypothetical protein